MISIGTCWKGDHVLYSFERKSRNTRKKKKTFHEVRQSDFDVIATCVKSYIKEAQSKNVLIRNKTTYLT